MQNQQFRSKLFIAALKSNKSSNYSPPPPLDFQLSQVVKQPVSASDGEAEEGYDFV